MKQIKRILALALLLCMLVLPAISFAAGQIDINQDVSFTVIYRDGETALTGARFDVYKVADIDANAVMYVTEEFRPFSVDLRGLDQEEWQQLAMRLKGEAQLKLKPLASAETDKNGDAHFTLKPGLYLVIGNTVSTDEDTTYVCDPFMAFLPGQDEESREWTYNVEAKPKHTHPITIHKILKVWDPDHKEEWKDITEVRVDILCDGEYWGTAVLTEENDWCYEWLGEIDPEHKHDWSFLEVKVDGFTPTCEIVGTTLKITNIYEPRVPLDDIPIKKKVEGNPSEKAKFTFVLKAKDPSYPMPEGSANGVKEITITGSGDTNFGKINFTKPGEYVYTIHEINEGLSGYTYDKTVYTITFHVTEDEDGLHTEASIVNSKGEPVKEIVFTNKYSEGRLPQTGLLWWPVPVLMAAGLMMVLVGLMRRRSN